VPFRASFGARDFHAGARIDEVRWGREVLLIRTPKGGRPFWRYVCTVVFGDWLGIKWRQEEHDLGVVELEFQGDHRRLRMPSLVIKPDSDGWMSPKSLPASIDAALDVSLSGFRTVAEDGHLPGLFAIPPFEVRWVNDVLVVPVDIIGAVFFMLSGYDEIASTDRDFHERFPATASCAYRLGFLSRPLADEYVEFLWAVMSTVWPGLRRCPIPSAIELTCDVDQPFDCTVRDLKSLARAGLGDLLKRRDIGRLYDRINCYRHNRSGNYQYDQFYTFTDYLEIARNLDLKTTFFFIPDSREAGNGCYSLKDRSIRALIKLIHRGGHRIGVHGTYQSYLSPEKTRYGRNALRAALAELGVSAEVDANRQHYLRWNSGATPRILDDCGFKYDYTGGYADIAGFRFGTSRDFRMFDWSGAQQLRLVQRPLIMMDCTVTDSQYMGLGFGDEAKSLITTLRARSMRYGGTFRMLWHNDGISSKQGRALLQNAIGVE